MSKPPPPNVSLAAPELRPCTHRPPCPACPRYGETGPAPRARERLSALARELGAPEARFIEGPLQAFRHRARLVVRGRARSPKIGLFQAGTHRIVDVPNCPIHHPLINRVGAALKKAMRDFDVPPYADAPHRGTIRALQVAVARGTPDRAQVVVVENAALPGAAAPVLDRLAEALGDELQGLFWNGNPVRTNTILGPHWRHWAGQEVLEERIGSARVFFEADGFGQSNLPLFDRIAERVAGWIAPATGRRVLELYAGSGALGLGLLAAGASVCFNEVSPGGLRGLDRGIAAQGEAARRRSERREGPAADVAPALLRDARFDAVLVDPPRRGLEPEVLAALCEHGPSRVVVVSCSLDAFEREARALCGATPGEGTYRLSEIEGYDLFPFTEHVETLALFERRRHGDEEPFVSDA